MATLSVHELLRRAGIDPKKSLGQNFLVDESYLDRIAATADLNADDIVLEVGPGLGTLTARLAAQAGCVVAVELDDRLIPFLRGEFALQENVHVVQGDILELQPAELIQSCRPQQMPAATASELPRAYKLVANLPYYITSAVLRHVLEAASAPSRAVVMVQEEVARRICAEPGEMSILSVAVQFYAEPRIAFRVPAGAFFPRPNVDSALLDLVVRPHPALAAIEDEVDEARFFALVRAGFGQKRKQLRNSLSAGLRMSKESADDALAVAGIEPSRRAQTLSIFEWVRLYQSLQS
jgi:16S rRNA (adenine1518-N6/adenine1519-N6)-dimethyltransferase